MDVLRLDSSEHQHEVKDSLLVIVYQIAELNGEKSLHYKAISERKSEIIEHKDDIQQELEQELQQEKKRKRVWQIVSGGLTILLILAL